MAPSIVTDNVTTNLETENGVNGKHTDEMHTGVRTLEVDFERFFGIEPSKVNRSFSLTLAEQSYLPKVVSHLFYGMMFQCRFSVFPYLWTESYIYSG